jgi:flagellar biosynthesis anti-sigma factor FlgM
MSIDRVNISNQGIDRSQGTKPNEPTYSAGKDRQVPAGTDSVALSSKANELNRVANSIEESRAARFNKVRAQLEAGSYQVSTRDLVQALIDSNMK